MWANMPTVDLPLDQLRVYRPTLTLRKDFSKFWDENRKLSEEQPLNEKTRRIDYPVKRLRVDLVTFDGFIDSSPINSWFLRPREEGPFPALLSFHGYGGNRGTVSDFLGWILQGYAIMSIDIRGQSGESPDFARYPPGSWSGNMTRGITDKNSYYYRYVYMDCLRALKFLLGSEDIEIENIGVTGVSQGGGISIVAAALDRRISLSLSEVPFLCHFERALDFASEGPYPEIMKYRRLHNQDVDRTAETLSYFDAMNFAPQIECPILVSVGLVDNVCPPSTIFGTFNQMTNPNREISIYHGMGHESLNYHQEKKIEWARRYLLHE